MKMSNLIKSFFILSIIFFNIVFRWPKHSYELGADSFFIHSLANYITYTGRADWMKNFFSVIGLTPGTYSSGVPFFLSGFSQISGCSINISILLFSFFWGILGFFTSYIFIKLFFKDDQICLLSAFAFSISPLFLDFTIWTTSTRALFIAILPVFLYLIIKMIEKNNYRFIVLIIILFIIEYSIHHMAILLLGVIIVSIFIKFIFLKIISMSKKIQKIILFVIIILSLFFFYLQLTNSWFYKDININYSYRYGYLLSGNSIIIIISNMFIDYGSKYGLIYIFAIVGVIYCVYAYLKQHFNMKQFILLTLIFIFIPILLLGTYNAFFLLIIFTLFLGYGIEWILKNKRIIIKRSLSIILGLLLISTPFFSMYMIDHWENRTRVIGTYNRVESWHYNTALYLNENNINNNLESNTWEWGYITAYSNTPPKYLQYENITLSSGSFEKFLSKEWIYESRLNVQKGLLLNNNWTDSKMQSYIVSNNPTLIINNRIPTQRADITGVYNSNLIQEVSNYKYQIYNSKELSVYNV